MTSRAVSVLKHPTWPRCVYLFISASALQLQIRLNRISSEIEKPTSPRSSSLITEPLEPMLVLVVVLLAPWTVYLVTQLKGSGRLVVVRDNDTTQEPLSA